MDIYDLWFSKINLSCKQKMNLIKTNNSIKNIYNDIIGKSMEVLSKGKNNKIAKINEDELKREQEYMEKNNIKCINCYSKFYPEALLNYDDAPSVIFYKGDITKLNEKVNVAIVGSRNSTFYGNNVAMNIAKDLGQNNINVVSGMAKGIDAMAHMGAMKAGGTTFAVLGCGVDVIYPRENIEVYNEIIQNGCLISEFTPKTKPYSWNFPMRNRIISALSDIVIVVEAGEKSGSLITVSTALEQGKDVMAVPGQIFSKNSIGTNKLIKDGAYPLTSVEDIYEMLQIVHNISYKDSNSIEKKYKKVYDILSDVPMHINEIIKITNIDIRYLHELLFEMQTINIVSCIDGSFYVKTFS